MCNETVLDLGRMRWEICKDEKSGKLYYQKTLHIDEETGMLIAYIRIPKAFKGSLQRHDTDFWIYVMKGQLETDGELYGHDTLIKYPEGIISQNGTTVCDEVEILLISSKAYTTEYVDAYEETGLQKEVVDVKGKEWFYRATSTDGKIFGKKGIVLDEDTGIQINYMNYPAGFTTYKHKHPAGHGFFVISGQLQSGGNFYGPDTFIWYPEGYITDHGASAYEDLLCLQISNKAFSIEYVK